MKRFNPRENAPLRGVTSIFCAIFIASLSALHAEDKDAGAPSNIVSGNAIVSKPAAGQGDHEFLQKVESGQAPDGAAPATQVTAPATGGMERRSAPSTAAPAAPVEKPSVSETESVKRQLAVEALSGNEKTGGQKSNPARKADATPSPKGLAHEKKKEFKKAPIASGPPVDASSASSEAGDRSSAPRRERNVVNSVPSPAANAPASPLPPGTTVTTVTTTQRGADGRLYTYEKKTTTYPSSPKPRFRLFHHREEEQSSAPDLTPFAGAAH